MPPSRDPHAAKSFRLLTLGGASLVDSAGRVVAEQRRRIALLALIASGRERGVARDRLIAALSPDRPAESARHALHQLIYYLRQQLGDEVFAGTDPLRLNPAIVASDAIEFETALQRDELESAVALYSGPFMDGFHLGESAEFEEWMSQERARLARLHAGALQGLARRAAQRGDLATAAEWWRRLAVLEPLSSAVALELMRALAAAGDRPAAIRHARIHEAVVRAQVGTAADPEVANCAAELQRSAGSTAGEPAAANTAVPPGDAGVAAPLPPSDDLRPALIPMDRPARRQPLRLAAAIIFLAVTIAGLVAIRSVPNPPVASGSSLIAVVPFRVAASDSSIGWLGEAVVDLLARRLVDESDGRAVDPRASIAAWESTGRSKGARAGSLEKLHRLGAGRVVTGSALRSGSDVVIEAELLRLPDGHALARAGVRGKADSILRLVDSLAIGLLAAEAGTDQVSLEGLAASPFPAVRAYLAGRVALRHGRTQEAVTRFLYALAVDSTLAPAALGLRKSTRSLDGIHRQRAESLALRHLDRLTPRERRLFLTDLGPGYPAWYPPRDRLEAWRAVVTGDWTAAEGWANLGHVYLGYGAQLDVPDPLGEAQIALERALDLSPGEAAEFRSDLYDLAAVTGNAELLLRAQRAGADNTEDESRGSPAWRRWLAAVAARDTAALGRVRPDLDLLTTPELRSAPWIAQRAGFGLEHGLTALALLAARAGSLDDRDVAARHRYVLALNLGRPNEATRLADRIHSEWPPLSRRAIVLRAALHGDGDASAGEAAARAIAVEAERPLATDPDERRSQLIHVCAGEQWRLAHGDTTLTARSLALLTRVPAPAGPMESFYSTCTAVIDVWRAHLARRPDSRAKLEALDSLLLRGHAHHWAISVHRSMAQLWERAGAADRALRAIRRRSFSSAVDLAADLREEGRLAAMVGDTSGAVRAWRHYLALRFDPEPTLRPERDSIGSALAQLEARPDS